MNQPALVMYIVERKVYMDEHRYARNPNTTLRVQNQTPKSQKNC